MYGTGARTEAPTKQSYTVPVGHEPSAGEPRNNLVGAYVLAVLIWPVGLVWAIYLAVAEKAAPVRRHAIGVAAVSLLTAAACIFIAVTVTGPANNASRVEGDLKSLLDDHAVHYSSVACTHQSGTQYGCFVYSPDGGKPQFAQVTDDGNSIYEQGIDAS